MDLEDLGSNLQILAINITGGLVMQRFNHGGQIDSNYKKYNLRQNIQLAK